jgi:hypothetical protein
MRPYLLQESTKISYQWDQIVNNWIGPIIDTGETELDPVDDALDLLTQNDGQDDGQDEVDDALDLLTQDDGQDDGQNEVEDALDLLTQDDDIPF